MKMGILTALMATAIIGTGVAQADIISETVTGTVFSGTDAGGFFGTAGADLTGASVSYTFSYDTSNTYLNLTTADGYFDSSGSNPGSMMASVTINSQAFAYSNPTGSYSYVDYFEALPPATAPSGLGFYGSDSAQSIQNTLYSNNAWAPTLVGDPNAILSFLANPSNVYNANLLLTEGGNQDNLYVANFAAAAPEPASLALFGVGIGGMAILRRRKTASR